jgi:hypothetical protein
MPVAAITKLESLISYLEMREGSKDDLKRITEYRDQYGI